MTEYKSFEESIRNSFDDLVGKSTDLDGNSEAVSQLMISILKKCHLYWNSLRSKGEMHQSLEDIMNLMKFLVKEYNEKQ